jgi:hypothetical protein
MVVELPCGIEGIAFEALILDGVLSHPLAVATLYARRIGAVADHVWSRLQLRIAELEGR